MKLIVIGAQGTIGNSIYKLGRGKGLDVVGTSSKKNQFLKFDFMNANYRELDSIIKFWKKNNEAIFAVIAAGLSNLNYCYKHIDISYKINIIEMKKLLCYFSEKGIKIVYFSSDAVFDGMNGNYDELSPVSPISIYGEQKVIIEKFISENIPNGLIYRLAKIVDSSLVGNHLFAEFYKKYLFKEPIKCIDGMVFNPTYLNDIAECVFIGLKKNLSGIYHLAAPNIFRREEIAEKFMRYKVSNYPIEVLNVKYFNLVEEKPLNSSLITTKFKKEMRDFSFTEMDSVIKIFWGKVDDGEYGYR